MLVPHSTNGPERLDGRLLSSDSWVDSDQLDVRSAVGLQISEGVLE